MSVALNVVGLASGVSLIIRHGGGMYLVTFDYLATIIWVMYGAWGLLVTVAREKTNVIAPRESPGED